MGIYGHLRPDRLADLPPEPISTEHFEWELPVWISGLPAQADHPHSIFRAVAELDADERAHFFYEFLSLANRVAVADRLDLSDHETLPETMEKAARVASRGLDFVAGESGVRPVDVLRRSGSARLFRVGVNLDPEGVRPPFSDDGQEEADSD